MIVQAQQKTQPLKSWRIHHPYRNCQRIAETKNRFYAASEKGFFFIEKTGGVLKRMSKIDGLNDVEVSELAYHEGKDMLIIAYKNTNIDIIRGDKEIINLPDILRKTIIGEKKINHITFDGNRAIISCSFGLVILNLDKLEISDSYLYIGPGSTSINVNSSTLLNDSIYSATDIGIMKAKLNYNTMSDNSNWKFVNNKKVKNVVAFQNRLFADFDSTLHSYNGVIFSPFPQPIPYPNSVYYNVGIYHGKLGIFSRGAIHIISPDWSSDDFGVNEINRGIVDADGVPWYGLGNYGLIKRTGKGPSDEVSFVPNGPASYRSYFMTSFNDEVWVTGGNIAANWGPAFDVSGYYSFKDNNWINREENPINKGFYDHTSMAYNPYTKKLYMGTHSFGVIEFVNGVPTRKFDNTNSSLKQFANFWTYAPGMACDDKGNLWISNYETDSALSVMTPAGKWKSFRLPTRNTGQMVIDGSGYKWMVTPRSSGNGICVFDDNKTPLNALDDQSVLISVANKLPTNEVRCLAFDGNFVWVGTAQGLAYIPAPERAFYPEGTYADQIVITQDGLNGYLLGNDVINCITVDGAGRKWIGTNTGAWLISESGREIVSHFNTDNSPIPSNIVQAIGINKMSGEVFFGTENGIISYLGDATEAQEVHSTLKIFPNPVKPGFEGLVAINGLARNASVRICDINGSVVYETKANGGTATWNTRTLSGTKVSSGVYLIFSNNEDATDVVAGKILIVR